MATIRKEFRVVTPVEQVWEALSDFQAVHTKLARGFVADSAPEEGGAVRAITFANGMKARERLVTIDPAAKRICYAIQDSPNLTHYSAWRRCSKMAAARASFGRSTSCLTRWLRPSQP